MALTPEDVVNKRFNPTKFREGYDQDEVDDFLDEVVVELRRLNQENEELRQRLVAADSRISELQRSASQAPVSAPAPAAAPAAAAPAPAPVPAPVPVPTPSAAPELAGQDASMDQSNTNNLLQLARRLHEEHVREGMEKRDQLIAEGHATAARLVSDAETQQRTAIEALEAEKTGLERRVEELRIFESEYREKLKGYIEGQLHELEAAAPISAPSQQPAFGSAPPAYDAPAVAAPAYDAPTPSAAPVYDSPVVEQPAQDFGSPSFGEYGQAPAPQPATASAPPAYAGFPAPQVTGEYPAAQPEQSSQQPEYPAYSQRTNDFPGLGGN
ncbi:DivIVA domain-containing protein [Protaetiibacter mangrovi]|uniref:DivIVA domain-containing protein n=1 Tax=Protaetiibacter mangrovi TaxID=2970926 RepID=UPI0027E59BA6|nr:DivIVA domain-containing protein [Protaetiibacter mangrovi]